MPFSHLDLQDPPSSTHSNIQCFLEYITPTLTIHLQQKPLVKDEADCFYLSDLWNLYVEWSSYGARVPIKLNSYESVVQYYSPSLSALQLYTSAARPSIPLIRNGDANPNFNDSINKKFYGAPETEDQLGFLYCQYNEITSPYNRLPFIEKINELAQSYPGLLKLKSTDISPYSWMAVAWYPIYQIPTMTNVRELSACFITYHRLSPPFEGLPNSIKDEDEKLKSMISWEKKSAAKSKGNGRGEISFPPFAMATYKLFGRLWINPEISDKERIAGYLSAASTWLKKLEFQHNDFNFFMARRF
ncbi:uncharacterized protein LOC123217062 isoform X2 [Mangifera indica]|uniref:uncharacterized protein LOC123217062 isoform X2 n=1 Tax=Mangifera indica TaxID=29780 RepID=UPI001CFA5985|nr:uncharacterized protein LOC123217062 isoform X2 [Mangifera indica]